MKEYGFRLLLDVPGELTDADLNALMAATHCDATFASDGSGWSAGFDREAPSFEAAVATATREIAGAGVGVTVRQAIVDEEAN